MGDTVTPEELAKLLSGPKPPRIIDVRRQADRENDPNAIPGSDWKDPDKALEWGNDLGSQDAVIYCVRGGSVSKSVKEKLSSMNKTVKYVEGGLEAWKAAGKTVTKDSS